MYDPTLVFHEQLASSDHGGADPVSTWKAGSESGDGSTSEIVAGFSLDLTLQRGAATVAVPSTE